MSAAIAPVRMPRYGMTMTEGAVARWLVPAGAPVAAGADLVEIETTKITNVETAAASGLLRRIVVGEGRIVPVGALIGVVAEAVVPDAEIDAFVAAHAAPPPADGEGAGSAPTDETVAVGPLTIAFRRTVPPAGGEAVPAVLVHGFGGDRDSWMILEPLLAEERTVVAMDLPGHGASDRDVGAGTVAALAGTLSGTLDTLGFDKVHLVGHSLGGAVALAAAAADPGRAASLTLVAPAGLGPDIDGGYLAAFLAADRRKELKDALGRLFADPEAVDRRMVDDVLRMKRQDGVPEALAAVAAACFPDGRQAADLRPALAALTCPVAVVWGEADRILPPAHAAGLPGSVTVVRVAGAGHMPQLEKPAEVARAVRTAIAAAGG